MAVRYDLVSADDDSAEIQKSRPGVPTDDIGAPVRDMHVRNGVRAIQVKTQERRPQAD